MKFSHWWLGLPGLIYDIGKSAGSKSSSSSSSSDDTDTSTDDEDSSTATNNYYYNYLNDSNTGNTLFNSKEKTRRTLFGTES